METSRSIIWFWVLFGFGILFRLIYVASDITDLASDEAYYWQWSRLLDWSYFSKGPLIAYLIHSGTFVLGDTELGVRIHTILLSAFTLYLSYVLYKRLFPNNLTGVFLLAVFYNCIPLMMVGSMISTIDPPLIACWITGTWALHKAVHEGGMFAWVALVFAIGLGILAKYTMLLFFFVVILYLILSPVGRKWFMHPAPYLVIVGGLLFLLPPLIWNWQNNWVTFHHTSDISQLDSPFSWQKNLLYFPEMIAVQAGLISPIIFVLLAIAMFVHIRKSFGANWSDASLLLMCSFLPVFVLYTGVSLKRSINGNWLAAMYPAMIVCAAQYWGKELDDGKGKAWVTAGAGLGVVMCLFMLFSDVVYLAGISQSYEYDPAARIKGWEETAAIAQESAQKLPDDAPFFYFSIRYQIPSQLAFYVERQPMTYSVPHPYPDTQYDIWGGSETRIGQNAVFVRREKPGQETGVPNNVKDSFERIEKDTSQVIERLGEPLVEVHTWHCFGFKGWMLQ